MIKNNCWYGQRCWIIGGGTSLKDFDFDMLYGEKVIVINRSLQHVPWADCFITMDRRFYTWAKNGTLGQDFIQAWKSFEGKKFAVNTEPDKFKYARDVRQLKCLGLSGIPTSLYKGVYTGCNSGYAGLQLAIILGANPIMLLGFDMYCGENGESHYHKEYPYLHNKFTYPKYIKHFEEIAPLIKKMGIEVININDPKRCGLRCFTFGKLDIKGNRRVNEEK